LTEAFCESGEKSWVDWVPGVVSAGMSEEVLSLNNFFAFDNFFRLKDETPHPHYGLPKLTNGLFNFGSFIFSTDSLPPTLCNFSISNKSRLLGFFSPSAKGRARFFANDEEMGWHNLY